MNYCAKNQIEGETDSKHSISPSVSFGDTPTYDLIWFRYSSLAYFPGPSVCICITSTSLTPFCIFKHHLAVETEEYDESSRVKDTSFATSAKAFARGMGVPAAP